MVGKRVVITGMGVVAANGIGLTPFWNALLENRSGVRRISLFDASDLKCRIAGEVKGFDPDAFFDASEKPKRMGRFTQFAGAAARMAVRDAGLTPAVLEGQAQFPVVMGISTTEMSMLADKPTAFTATNSIPHAATSLVGYLLNAQPRLITVSNGCASGLDAVALAVHLIQAGAAELAVAGSAEASIARYVMEGMVRGRMIDGTYNDAPDQASRPFDRRRGKGVLAEGSGVVVLETLEHALARGALPYAAITGAASCADPRGGSDCDGMTRTMRMAVANAQQRLEHVDCINAHAPSDLHIDAMETAAIKEVFGRRAYAIPVVSIKGSTGNAMGASGVHQVISTALTIRHGVIPPTTNFTEPDEACDLDYVPGRPRKNFVRCALVNSHGFGRGNVTVVMEPAD